MIYGCGHAEADTANTISTTIPTVDTTNVDAWMSNGQLVKLDDETAMDWEQRKPAIWTVVVAPWILVQEHGH